MRSQGVEPCVDAYKTPSQNPREQSAKLKENLSPSFYIRFTLVFFLVTFIFSFLNFLYILYRKLFLKSKNILLNFLKLRAAGLGPGVSR